jgi:hypothetical protein
MTRPIVAEIKVDTGETIVREMNDEEYTQHLIDKSDFEAKLVEESTND